MHVRRACTRLLLLACVLCTLTLIKADEEPAATPALSTAEVPVAEPAAADESTPADDSARRLATDPSKPVQTKGGPAAGKRVRRKRSWLSMLGLGGLDKQGNPQP